MKELAPGVWHVKCLPGLPAYGVNAYLVDDVLIDAGARQSKRRILRQLRGHKVSAHALTHAHPDHQGASHDVCETLAIPFWAPQGDDDAAENPELINERQPDHAMAHFFYRIFHGPGHKVDRVLKEGDEVGGFKVVSAPGHSAGHVVFWRESDKVLIIGDVLTNMDQLTLLPGLNEPKSYLTPDPAKNRESARKLAKLEPELVCFGHGRPLRDPGKFVEFIAKLPD
jgi:glyoxylase-like metal-dependent hydrolase (beta-lactamase superfamily II)